MNWLSKYFMPLDQLKLIHKAWSFRFAAIGTVLTSIYVSVPVFSEYITPKQFLFGNIALGLAILVSRIMNQSGIDF